MGGGGREGQGGSQIQIPEVHTILVLEKTACFSQNQFHVRFNISNTVYKTWFILRKFKFELKLRNTEIK